MNWAFLLQTLQHLTPAQVAARYAYQGVRRALEVELFYGFCLTPQSARDPGGAIGKVEFGFVDEARLRREAREPHSGLDPAQVERSLAAGEECFGAFIGDVLASHIWFSRSPAHLVRDVHVHFDRDYAYSRWAFTRTPYRGLHLHARCKRLALLAFARRGLRGILSVVSAENFDSIKSATRVGCQSAGLLLVTGQAERRRVWKSTSCALYGLRLELAEAAPLTV